MSLVKHGYRRILFAPLLVASVAVLTALPAGASSGFSQQGSSSNRQISVSVDSNAEQEFLNHANSLRASRGLGTLRSNSELLAKARGWSQTQANAGRIFHSTLTTGVTQNWHRLGENVGMGPEVLAIHNALVNSPRHLDNLIDSGFTDVGIGVVRQGNTIYVTQVFMQLMPETDNVQPAPKNPPQQQKSGQAASTPKATQATPVVEEPVAQAVPLKTASADLAAIIQKISSLES